MLLGTLYALVAGLMWGLVFIGPVLLPEYPAVLQSFARYFAFGLIALPLAWFDRNELRRLARGDWLEAFKLSTVGNLLYYLFLASAIQRAGAPLPTMIIGTLPVVIAICANLRNGERDGHLPWRRLLPSLLLITAGIACVNHVELSLLRNDAHADERRYAIGALCALGAVMCWTWYPLRNADWLRNHGSRNPRTWATAQGLATLPLAALGYLLFWLYCSINGSVFAMPFGPRPAFFIGLMFAIGLFASWLGTLCWNEASQRLTTALVGQLIVFETVAALVYAFILRREFPQPLTLLGILLLIVGVVWAVRVKPEPVASAQHST
ncbi:MAG: DMT family transporter [Spongiibacteraceae bacterium]